MTISRLDLKVSEVCIALGSGSKVPDLISEMVEDGFPRPIIDSIMLRAQSMLKDMEQEESQDERSLLISRMISEALDIRTS